MTTKTYGQYCGVARALELVGERWALLIVRDLLVGPKRYTDLRAGLPLFHGRRRRPLSCRIKPYCNAQLSRRAAMINGACACE